jgi:hypothetical protein
MVDNKPQRYLKFVFEACDKIKERKDLNDLFLD